MSARFDYDRTRQDPAFHAVMKTAEKVKNACDKALCPRCEYHRQKADQLVVCYTERLADELIRQGLIDRKTAGEILPAHSRR